MKLQNILIRGRMCKGSSEQKHSRIRARRAVSATLLPTSPPGPYAPVTKCRSGLFRLLALLSKTPVRFSHSLQPRPCKSGEYTAPYMGARSITADSWLAKRSKKFFHFGKKLLDRVISLRLLRFCHQTFILCKRVPADFFLSLEILTPERIAFRKFGKTRMFVRY